jgi:hypothetical protein
MYAVLAWEIKNTTDVVRAEITQRLHAAVPRPPTGAQLATCVTVRMGDTEFRDMGRKLAAIAADFWMHFSYLAYLLDDNTPRLPAP